MNTHENESLRSAVKEYKGISLEGLDKKTSMAHSRFFEIDEGVEWFDALLARDKSSLSPDQFQAISALNSVVNMNYQICNGGLAQYYLNGYDQERAPFNADDVKQVDKANQVEMLRELHVFGKTIFPERELENERLDRIISDFENSHYEEEAELWYSDEENEYGEYAEEEGGLVAPYDFDRRYYKVNDYLESLIEAYAQYLDKSIEMELIIGEKNLFDVPTRDGRTKKLRVEVGYLGETNNLLVTIYPNIKEPEYGWDCPLVDMGENLGRQPLMCTAVEVRRGDYDIPKFLEESGLAKPTGIYISGKSFDSGEGTHPIYEFDLERLLEIEPEMTTGFTVEQARDYLAMPTAEKPLDALIREAREKAADRNGSSPDPNDNREGPSRKNTEPERW